MAETTVPASLLDVARVASLNAREAGLGGDDQLRAIITAVLDAEGSPTRADTVPAVLRLAEQQLKDSNVLAAIRASATSERLAHEAIVTLAVYVGYSIATPPAEQIEAWQCVTAEHEIRRILAAAADHAQGEGR